MYIVQSISNLCVLYSDCVLVRVLTILGWIAQWQNVDQFQNCKGSTSFYFFILGNVQVDQEPEFSTSQVSFLGDLLGEENIRRLSEVSNHVQTTSSSDQCFFCLLL